MDKIYLSGLSDMQWSKIKVFFDTRRKRKHSLRLILNGIFYLLKSGCQWRMPPKGFPPHGTVYYYYQKWKGEGALDEINDYLVGQPRAKAGRGKSPSAVCLDSQSVKTTRSGWGQRGVDGGKKIKGGKRYIVTDTLYGWFISIVLRSDKTSNFEVLPKRWVVERTFSWFESYRRPSKDFEYLTGTSGTMVKLASIRLLLNRIT